MRSAALPFLLSGTLLLPLLPAQVCRITATALNQERRVIGGVNTECPTLLLHSAPFGNWGVTSNFGAALDGHQFDGWCHNTRICDNNGNCRTDCGDGWYEWNSCTDHSQFKAPNCTLYNAADCTQQVTSTGVNTHGSRTLDVPVSCPQDTRWRWDRRHRGMPARRHLLERTELHVALRTRPAHGATTWSRPCTFPRS